MDEECRNLSPKKEGDLFSLSKLYCYLKKMEE